MGSPFERWSETAAKQLEEEKKRAEMQRSQLQAQAAAVQRSAKYWTHQAWQGSQIPLPGVSRGMKGVPGLRSVFGRTELGLIKFQLTLVERYSSPSRGSLTLGPPMKQAFELDEQLQKALSK